MLTGKACSTCTAVHGVCVVCHYKKCTWPLIGQASRDIVNEVIEVDELDEGSISAAAGKQNE